MSTELLELGAVFPAMNPTLRRFDNRTRLILDTLPNETVEIYAQPDHEPFYVVESIYMDESGSVHRIILAVTYGLALIPPMVREYAAIRTEQVAR